MNGTYKTQHHFFRCRKIRIQQHRAKQGFQPICQNRRAAKSGTFAFAFAQQQLLAQIQLLRQNRQGLLLTRLERRRDRSPSGKSG